jgi:predicted permease
VTSAIASATLFRALGISPLHGRAYTEEEDLPGAEPVVVLSHELWQRAFGGDESLVGRTIEVSGAPRTVLGIMPPGFDVHEAGIELWQPLALDPANRTQRGSHYLYLVGRLASGATLASASSELASLVQGWAEQNPGTHVPSPDNHPMSMISLQEEIVGGVRSALYLLLGAVGFVLLIACANVANLLLVRAEDRHKEVAVRVAMGAGRLRLLRQLLTEGLLLSVLGSGVALLIAWLSLEGLRALGPGDIPRLREISLDGRVLFFTTGIALATGAFFGVAPIRHVTRGAPAAGLSEGGQRASAGGARVRLRTMLVTSEMALALMLAVGAGLLVRSFQALTSVDPGFEPDGVLTFQLALPTARYPELGEVVAFHDRVRDALVGLPGVQNVATMTGLPPLRDLNANDTQFEGIEPTPDGPPQNVDFYQVVSASYLETMRVAVLEGRGFAPSDLEDAVPVVMVNEALARRFYPGQSAVGRRIRPCCGDAIPWFEIVGVVADVKQAGLDAPVGTELYFHVPQAAQIGVRAFNVVVRTSGNPEALIPSAREAIRRLDSSLPLAGVRSMDGVLAGARARPRFLTLLLGAFAALALVLAAVGTYGVMSYSVAQRAKELGIRMALGAERGSVLTLVLRQGLTVTAVGIAIGLVGAWALTGFLQDLLFQVAPRDFTTFVAGPAVLVLVALVALWIPARRATHVSVTEVLRQE